jgi:ubiquinone/menaquinone biosynthesis C-methylase UbiE
MMDMESTSQPPQGNHTYLGDPENAAEMGRLLLQDQFVSTAMGGVLPESIDISRCYDVLDVGSGTGGWVLGMATKYPHLNVTGIDISWQMISFARVQAHREEIRNVQFEIRNVLEPLAFPDHSFDLVNMRFALGFIRRSAWPAVLRELYRVTRPGGIVRLVEADHGGVTNSAAYDDFNQLLSVMFYRAGYGFSASGANHAIKHH